MFQEIRTSKIFSPNFCHTFSEKEQRINLLWPRSSSRFYFFGYFFGCVPSGSIWDQIRRTGGHVVRKVRKTIFCWWIYFFRPSQFCISGNAVQEWGPWVHLFTRKEVTRLTRSQSSLFGLHFSVMLIFLEDSEITGNKSGDKRTQICCKYKQKWWL